MRGDGTEPSNPCHTDALGPPHEAAPGSVTVASVGLKQAVAPLVLDLYPDGSDRVAAEVDVGHWSSTSYPSRFACMTRSSSLTVRDHENCRICPVSASVT